MALSLKLLGEFAVRDGAGTLLSLPTRKTRALLGYLAVNMARPQARDRLMALLWSDRSEKQARHSLSQALMSIRKLGDGAGETLFEGDGERISLFAEALDSDVVRFRALLADNPAGAAALYEGPLLDGLAVPDPAFDTWLMAARAELHEEACDALARAADAAVVDGDTPAAIDFVRRLLDLDPLREDGYRRLMRLLLDGGDRAGALRQFQACADILKKELGVEPDATTRALQEEISREISEAKPERLDGMVGTDAEKPTIAILPFSTPGNDPDQDILGDGMAEDIITGLSRFHSISVAARSASFAYRDKSHDTTRTARALGARYLLEGGVRRSGARLRITAQLVDAESGQEIWSERYDREPDDIFAVQDEITEAIIASIEPAIGYRERERVRRMRPRTMDVWALYQQGLGHYYHGTSTTELQQALKFFSEAVRADQDFAAAHAMRAEAMVRILVFTHNAPEERSATLREALESARTAIRLDPGDSTALVALGWVNILRDDTNGALAATDRALALNPYSASAYDVRGFALSTVGNYQEALECLRTAERLSPNHPYSGGVLTRQAFCLFGLARYNEAVEAASRAMQGPNRGVYAAASRAASLMKLGRDEEARATVRELMSRAPKFTLSMFQVTNAHMQTEYIDNMKQLLRAAGVPE